MINTTIIKLAVWALVLKEIWLLMQVPSIANAVISFCTVGAIPGTDDTLSPGSTVIVLSVAFVLAALLIFRKEWIAALRSLFGSSSKPMVPPMPLAPLRAMPITTAPAAFAAPKAPRVHKFVFVSKLRLTAQSVSQRVTTTAYQLAQKAKHTGIRLFVMAKARLLPFGALIINLVILASVIIADLAVRAWRLVRPYFERFDKYLEQKAHKNPYTDAVIKAGSDALVVLKGWWAEIKDKEALPKLERK